MPSVEIIGFIAAFLTTASFLPQVYKTWKTKDVSGLSLPMFAMFFLGVLLWLVYGFLIDSPSIIAANGVTLLSALIIIYFIFKYRKP